jgi:uncharacterized membrane protein YdjX (TVP38/TMEM64 family)
MKHYLNFLQTSIIVLILGLNCYTMANGLRLGSLWGILLSVGSLVALGYCIHLFRKLQEIDSEEEY